MNQTTPFRHHHRIFLWVAGHMIAQGHRAKDRDDACVYRNEEGAKCAAGCLISDDVYDLSIDENGDSDLEGEVLKPDNGVAHAIAQSIGANLDLHAVHLIRTLQQIHDVVPPHRWAKELLATANREFTLAALLQRNGRPVAQLDWLRSYVPKSQATVDELRDAGAVVVVFNKDELGAINPSTLESELIILGNELIEEATAATDEPPEPPSEHR